MNSAWFQTLGRPRGGMCRCVGTLLLAGSVSLAAPRTGRGQSAQTQPTTRPAPGAVGAAPAADPAPAPAGPTVYRMTVTARATTRPALTYELLPDLVDTTPGNAANVFMLAFAQLAQLPADFFNLPEGYPAPPMTDDKISLFLDIPPDQLKARRKDVDAFLGPFKSIFQNADLAARREECHWGLPDREEGFGLLLPHLNHARRLASLLVIRERLQILDGDWAGARQSLQTGFALGRDLNEHSFLVQNLVGTAVGAVTLRGVREWQQRPDAPNLYWGLGCLPHPYMDFRNAMQWERAALAFTFPRLKKLESGTFTEEDWRDFQVRLNQYASQSNGVPWATVGSRNDLAYVAMSIVLYPQAKKHLIEWGWDERKVQEMPAGQVLAEYEFGDYQRSFDEMMKWANLPFWQAYEGMSRATSDLRKAQGTGIANPLLTFVPAVASAYLSGTRLDRDIAAAQTIEALRDYAGKHDGKAPDKLEDLTDTPAPLDPITGKVFEYHVEPGPGVARQTRITLNCPMPPDQHPSHASRYDVTIVKP